MSESKEDQVKKFLSVIIMLGLSNFVFSCDCGWGGPFLKMAHKGDAILKGKVKQHSVLSANGYPIAMEFEVNHFCLCANSPRF